MVWDIPLVTCSPLSTLLMHSQPPGSEVRSREAMMFCKPCSATGEPSLCYQHCLQHKSKIQPYISYCEGIYLSQKHSSWGFSFVWFRRFNRSLQKTIQPRTKVASSSLGLELWTCSTWLSSVKCSDSRGGPVQMAIESPLLLSGTDTEVNEFGQIKTGSSFLIKICAKAVPPICLNKHLLCCFSFCAKRL